MEELEIHFFHGFLGAPDDWHEVIQSFGSDRTIEFICHNLTTDFRELGSQASFESWANYKTQQLSSSKRKKVLVGYSMGGRLLMHLKPKMNEPMVLIGAHPGLRDGKESRARVERQWVDRFDNEDVGAWLQAWNAQDVFKNDRNRPLREFSKEELREQLFILQTWSLSKQDERDSDLSVLGDSLRWVYGERDQKFSPLRKRMAEFMSENNIHCVAECGHGVLFDAPGSLAALLEEVIGDVG